MLTAFASLMASAFLLTAAEQIALEEQTRHADCLARIEADPVAAYEFGLAWLSEGGRPPARHCTALALVAMHDEIEGAMRLEQLASAPDAGGLEPRAIYLAQAGNAWMLAGRLDEALVAFANALKLTPGSPDILRDRARAHLLRADWKAAGKDLDAALQVSSPDAETLRLRAHALMGAGRLEDAMADIEHAMRLDPRNVDVLLMRGRIREAIAGRTADR